MKMDKFDTVLAYLNKFLYEPNQLTVSSIDTENQNSEYAAGRFVLSTTVTSKTVRLRVAKITPTKIGQFVTFWQKDEGGTNQAFNYEQASDLLVITAFRDSATFGQFVFPKNILREKGILKTDSNKGKMGMRVYPSWDTPVSKAALATQRWQLDYFFYTNIKANKIEASSITKILKLYTQ